ALRFQQQRNEIMKKFFQLVKSASPAPYLTHPPFLKACASHLALLETPAPAPIDIRVNPWVSATAKPETITRLLQNLQPEGSDSLTVMQQHLPEPREPPHRHNPALPRCCPRLLPWLAGSRTWAENLQTA
ncbi:hypothetical protein ACW18P_22730, partial [Bordetella bronchiseptica]